MLTVKFEKYGKINPAEPTPIEHRAIYQCKSVHTVPKGGMIEVQLDDAPGHTITHTVAQWNKDAAFTVAYVMNEAGRTIETIR